MKTTRIIIRNLFGISEVNLDGKSIEITGPKGAGKTSVLDSIRYALTNRSNRDFIIRSGEEEGEILIETDTGLSIDRKARMSKADQINVKDGKLVQTRPAEFLNSIFTPLQLNPVEFLNMTRQEKNRVILSLIEFDWDINWLTEKFGELPAGINYQQHILQILADIQADNSPYYTSRQNINREIRNKTAMIEDISADIPETYDAVKWKAYDLGAKYAELETKRKNNALIEKARMFASSYNDKIRGIKADFEIARSAAEKAVANERDQITSTIERLKAQLKAEEDKLLTLDDKLIDKIKVIAADYETAKAKLDKDNAVAMEWSDKDPIDVTELTEEVATAEAMKLHLNEYARMVSMQSEVTKLEADSSELTRKIEIARDLPGEILKTATIPVKGLTVENGIPLINGLPISNLSDGELLELCVDVSVQKPGNLQIILVDGAEKLDAKSRAELYKKCKAKGLQLIATRVTDDDALEVTEL